MDNVVRYVGERAFDNSHVFVFPSEVVAAFWRREVIFRTQAEGVWADRFVSWDTFKEMVLQKSREAVPVNSAVRTLFTENLLIENAEEPFFSSIIPPSYAEEYQGFTRYVRDILPLLKEFTAVYETYGGPPLNKKMIQDIEVLYGRYGQFLEKNGLYEPAWADLNVAVSPEITYTVFFPELIEDFPEFARQLEDNSSVSIFRLTHTRESDTKQKIFTFETDTEELKALFFRLRQMLDSGIPHNQIAITHARLSEYAGRLSTMAKMYDIPLTIRAGFPITEYPAGVFLQRLGGLLSEGFPLEEMKDILLNRAVSWKKPGLAAKLIRFGIDFQCVRNDPNNPYRGDIWKKKLSKHAEGTEGFKDLPEFYQKLSGYVYSIVQAKNFDRLKQALVNFSREMLDFSDTSNRFVRVFQFSLSIIDDFIEAGASLDILHTAKPYRLFIQALSEKIYVPRDRPEGIPVYAYRVSAGIHAKHHIILGADQDAAEIRKPKFPFLQIQDQENIEGNPLDMTEEFIRAYGISGGQVEFSYHTESTRGPSLPPAYFVEQEAVNPYPLKGRLRNNDVFSGEEGLWSGRLGNPEHTVPIQKQGFSEMSSLGFGDKKTDYTKNPIDNPDILTFIEKRLDKEGYLGISNSSLDVYRGCPFAFLLQKPYKIEEEEYEIAYEDPRLLGRIQHKALEKFYKELQQNGERLKPEQKDLYKKRLKKAAEKVFETYEKAGVALIPPVWNSQKKGIQNELQWIIDKDLKDFPDTDIYLLEKTYQLKVKKENLLLDGRIDRITKTADGYVLIDYKRSNINFPKGRFTGDPEYLESLQIPFYTMLAEENGLDVTGAAYYIVRDGKYIHILKEGTANQSKLPIDKSKLDQHAAYTRNYASVMAEKIRGGKFETPPPHLCNACSFRGVCRIKYAVRFL